MTKPIDATEVVEVYQVICPVCQQKYWEPHEGRALCPLCGGDTSGAAYVSDEARLIYPVLVDPLTGTAVLGPPVRYPAEEVCTDV